MHTLTGFIVVIFLVFLLKVFLKKIKIFNLSFWLFSLVGFCFSLTIGVVFELYEYSIDKFFLKDMQKDYLVNDIATIKLKEDDLKKIQNIKKTIIYYQANDKLQKVEIENGYLDIGLNDTIKDLIVNLIRKFICIFLSKKKIIFSNFSIYMIYLIWRDVYVKRKSCSCNWWY